MKKTLLLSLLVTLHPYLAPAVVTPPALANAISNAVQGDVIGLSGINPAYLSSIPMTTNSWTGGYLVLSDSPESPTAPVMLYKDANLPATDTNANRVFAYHVNNRSSGYLRFSVLLKNNGTSSGTLTVQKTGVSGPSASYAYVGKVAFNRWLSSSASNSVTVSPGQVVRLDMSFDTITVAVGYLLHGIWDYTFTQPHTIMICALNTADNPVTVGPTLPVAARDSHTRGTFAYSDKIYDTDAGYVLDTANGMLAIDLAGGGNDVNVEGVDNAVTPPTSETDYGNYGVLYHSHLATVCSDGRNQAFLFNPRGSSWGGAIWMMPGGILPGGKFLIPSSTVMVTATTNAAVAGRYNTGTNGSSVWFQFMPTGGSSLPLKVLAVPH